MKNRHSLALGITLVVLSVVAFSVNASNVVTFQVNAGYVKMWTYNLNNGDKFDGSLAISGGGGNDIDFWITDPQGTTILNQGRVSQGTTFEFTARLSGAYTLHFDNGFSLISMKTISMTYDIASPQYSGGMDLTFLFTIIVAVVILLLLVVGLAYALGRRSKSKTNHHSPSDSQQPTP